MLREDQIERYARHILLREVGGVGQERILGAAVSILGLPEAGCWAASYLALAGVGELLLGDERQVPAEGLLPMIGEGAAGAPRDEALLPQLSLRNSDVGAEVCGILRREAAQLREEGWGALGVDPLLVRIDPPRRGQGDSAPAVLTSRDEVDRVRESTLRAQPGGGEARRQGVGCFAAGNSAVVGWLDRRCIHCIKAALQDDAGRAVSPALAALAGSRVASAILAATLDPLKAGGGLVLVGAEGDRPLPPCTHR